MVFYFLSFGMKSFWLFLIEEFFCLFAKKGGCLFIYLKKNSRNFELKCFWYDFLLRHVRFISLLSISRVVKQTCNRYTEEEGSTEGKKKKAFYRGTPVFCFGEYLNYYLLLLLLDIVLRIMCGGISDWRYFSVCLSIIESDIYYVLKNKHFQYNPLFLLLCFANGVFHYLLAKKPKSSCELTALRNWETHKCNSLFLGFTLGYSLCAPGLLRTPIISLKVHLQRAKARGDYKSLENNCGEWHFLHCCYLHAIDIFC